MANSLSEKLFESKQILEKEAAIKKLREEGVSEIVRSEFGIMANVFISDEFLSQFADFIAFQNYVGGK